MLVLVLPLFVRVAGLADRFGANEKDLSDALIGIDLRGEGSSVADLNRDLSPPFRLERSHIDDDPAPCVGRLRGVRRSPDRRDGPAPAAIPIR